jgi:hypothetical protein
MNKQTQKTHVFAIAKIENNKILGEDEVTHVIKAVGSMKMQCIL